MAKKGYLVWQNEKCKKSISCFKFGANKELIDKHLRILIEAIDKVKDSYLTYALDGLPIPPKYAQRDLIMHTERVFAYELYHQWSRLIDKRTKWVINAEVRKCLELFKDISNSSSETESSWNFPDLVLHKGQEKNEQLIACEIKRIDRLEDDFTKDINTLYILTRPATFNSCNEENNENLHPYLCGIFLLINGDYDNLKNIVKASIKELERLNIKQEAVKNIICVFLIAKDGKKEVGFQSLFNIWEQQK